MKISIKVEDGSFEFSSTFEDTFDEVIEYDFIKNVIRQIDIIKRNNFIYLTRKPSFSEYSELSNLTLNRGHRTSDCFEHMTSKKLEIIVDNIPSKLFEGNTKDCSIVSKELTHRNIHHIVSDKRLSKEDLKALVSIE